MEKRCSAWNTSKPVKDAEWLLPSINQWDYMVGTNGAGSYTALRDGFNVVGTSLKYTHSDYYWSSTGSSGSEHTFAQRVTFYLEGAKDYGMNTSHNVRAALAF